MPLSQQAKERLQIMRESNDGFLIAEKDLSIRGLGELFGSRQTGVPLFRFANLLRDQHLFKNMKKIAKRLFDETPEHAKSLRKRWYKRDDSLSHV
jgi:ATP-dependent DNA helicase RecG